MAKHTATRFFSSALGNFVRHHSANSTKTKFAAFHLTSDLFAMFRSSAFCDHDNSSQITSRFARLDHGRNLVVMEWDLGDQNDIGAAGEAPVQCDPAGVSPHHFNNHDAPVASRRSVQPIER